MSDMQHPEEWRPVVGREGSYSISDRGRVRSEARVVVHSNGFRQRVPQLILKLRIDNWGYLRCGLCKNHKVILRPVHQLVLEAFVGPRPPGMLCCHGDGNPANPHLTNLRWGTRKDNAQDAIKHGTMPRGVGHSHARLTDEIVLAIRADKDTHERIALKYGVSQGLISRVKLRKSWRHVEVAA